MATITLSSELDVAEKYDILVKQSLSTNSVYIRAKETIQELVDGGSLDEAKKAEVITNVVGSIVNGITNASMSTALQWASTEKEIALKKLELEQQLDILAQDKLLKEAQVDKVYEDTRLAKVESKRMFGTGVFDGDGNIISIDNTGKVAKDIELTTEQIGKVASETVLTDQKVKESYAAVHKIVADTYTNFGSVSYTLGANGMATNPVPTTAGGFVTLSDVQRVIGSEQAKGYTYNAWANALTGSASMLGTAIAAEYAEFTDPTKAGYTLLQNVLSTANNLGAATEPTI